MKKSDTFRAWGRVLRGHSPFLSLEITKECPQEGDESQERLRAEDCEVLFEELCAVAAEFPKVQLPRLVLEGYRKPPQSPEECTFARLTTCVSADLKTRVTPCQLGGKPVCSECGCIASAAMHALANLKLGGMVQVSSLLDASIRLGQRIGRAA
jgi:hypothetical protein